MKNERLTPAQSIKAYCRGCAETKKGVRECADTNCPLWRWRKGTEVKDDLFREYRGNQK